MKLVVKLYLASSNMRSVSIQSRFVKYGITYITNKTHLLEDNCLGLLKIKQK